MICTWLLMKQQKVSRQLRKDKVVERQSSCKLRARTALNKKIFANLIEIPAEDGSRYQITTDGLLPQNPT